MVVVSGRNTSALTNIPAFAINSVKFYKLQAKSITGADYLVFEGARTYLKSRLSYATCKNERRAKIAQEGFIDNPSDFLI